jgi:hypothetical protein
MATSVDLIQGHGILIYCLVIKHIIWKGKLMVFKATLLIMMNLNSDVCMTNMR